ncbi:hypothetical protein AAFF_G00173060 [Aldrovandia affinis]|uniref:Transmembrane protein n=1 Tax=Aldrovandia affinis TaxID=143900 RepID=A0AAD7WW82_9TELE|nr:hypothetical protein AAFF_G00173060 [Aldrovandia affinis]
MCLKNITGTCGFEAKPPASRLNKLQADRQRREVPTAYQGHLPSVEDPAAAPAAMSYCQRQCVSAPVVALHVAVLAQLLFALLVEHAEFVRSGDVLISPFHFCVRGPGGMECHVAPSRSVSRLLQDLLVVCVYAPVVLVQFSALAYVFAVFYADGAILRCSMACQAVSCGATLFGLSAFLATHWSHVQGAGLTLSFYLSACSCVEMAAGTALSWLGREGIEHGKETAEPERLVNGRRRRRTGVACSSERDSRRARAGSFTVISWCARYVQALSPVAWGPTARHGSSSSATVIITIVSAPRYKLRGLNPCQWIKHDGPSVTPWIGRRARASRREPLCRAGSCNGVTLGKLRPLLMDARWCSKVQSCSLGWMQVLWMWGHTAVDLVSE